MRVLAYRLAAVCMMRKMTVQETLGRNAEQEDEQQEKSLAGSYFLCGDQKMLLCCNLQICRNVANIAAKNVYPAKPQRAPVLQCHLLP